jgi:hypothetical protein
LENKHVQEIAIVGRILSVGHRCCVCCGYRDQQGRPGQRSIGIKGIGPSLAKSIIDERKKGDFKDWADFEKRVKGVKEKRAAEIVGRGFAHQRPVGSASLVPAPSAKPAKKDDPKKS